MEKVGTQPIASSHRHQLNGSNLGNSKQTRPILLSPDSITGHETLKSPDISNVHSSPLQKSVDRQGDYMTKSSERLKRLNTHRNSNLVMPKDGHMMRKQRRSTAGFEQLPKLSTVGTANPYDMRIKPVHRQ